MCEQTPTCDICDGHQHMDDCGGDYADWNPDTGNHISCEEYRAMSGRFDNTQPEPTAVSSMAAWMRGMLP